MNFEFIVVYGTLHKKINSTTHSVLAHHCHCVSDGFMYGKRFDLNGYPGAIESSDIKDSVHGGIYNFSTSNKVLHLLDEYEECNNKFPKPHEYIRKKLPITLANGDIVSAWVYVFNHDVSFLMQIESGDYTNNSDF